MVRASNAQVSAGEGLIDSADAAKQEGGVRRRRRTPPKGENRQLLMAAADRLFREKGFDATSTRDIIAAAGLNPGTFYHCFQDKEELFRTLLYDHTRTALLDQREYRCAAPDFAEFVRRHFERYFHDILDHPHTFELLKRNAATIREILPGDDPHLGMQMLAEDIADYVARGEIPPVDTELLAYAIAGICLETGPIIANRESPDVKGAIAFATRLILQGVS